MPVWFLVLENYRPFLPLQLPYNISHIPPFMLSCYHLIMLCIVFWGSGVGVSITGWSDTVTAPLLIMVGGQDVRVPMAQSMDYYKVI